MTTQQTAFITVTCDGPKCDKTVTFPATAEDKANAERENPWLLMLREVVTSDRRQFAYCSDTCEAEAIAVGVHNRKEPNQILIGNAQQAELAAQAAAQAARAQAAIRAGQPITIRQS